MRPVVSLRSCTAWTSSLTPGSTSAVKARTSPIQDVPRATLDSDAPARTSGSPSRGSRQKSGRARFMKASVACPLR